MSDAKKCDICGDFFEIHSDPQENECIVVGFNRKTYDCCPRCTSAIMEYCRIMKNESEEEPDSNRCKDCPTPEVAHLHWVAEDEVKIKEPINVCDTCKHGHLYTQDWPCNTCINTHDHTYWEAPNE